MSIASEITSIGENLKKDYQAIANLGADLTNVDKNIENIAELLDGVYDNLPKTEYQEGTEVTIENTLKGKLDFDDGKVGFGQTEQDSTQGYNILNLKDGTYTASGVTVVVVNGKATISGTSTSLVTVPILLNNSLTLTNNQIYSLYGFNEAINGDVAFRPISGDGYFQVPFSSVNNAVSLNFTNSTTTIDRITIRVANGVTLNNLICRPMVVVGNDTTKSYEPYTGGQASPNPSYPQTINSVTGNQDVVVSGKNLVPFPYSSQAGLISGVNWSVNADGTINATGTANASSSIFYLASGDDDIYLDAGTYKISSNFSGTDFSWQVIQIVNGGYGTVYWDNMVLTETTRLRIRVIAKPNATVNVQNAYMMIERGNTATTYEPYITPKSYQLSLGDIELNAIGNYKDELVYDVDEDKVYKNEKIGKYTCTGQENDWSVNQRSNGYQFDRPLATMKIGVNNVIEVMSNYFKGIAFNSRDSVNESIYSGNNDKNIRILTNVASTINAFKTWLSTHNTTIYYILATPTLTELTDETLHTQVKALYNAHSNNGTTIITSYGNLPMIIKVRGLKGE